MDSIFLVTFLGIAAFLAGLVDAVVGGGGLIQLPALLSAYPNTSTATVFATNKIASLVGTSGAAYNYMRKVSIPYKIVLPGALAAFVGAALGASVVTLLPKEVMRPLVLVMLILVGAYTLLKKNLGQGAGNIQESFRTKLIIIGIGAVVGFYAGFFGPGAGSFFIFLLVRFTGMDFLQASTSAKIMNVCTNLGALLYFGVSVEVMWKLGIFMAVCNLIGAQIGSSVAIKKGSAFVRKVFLVVVSILIIKLLYDTLKSFT